mgnify:CR=1 FL=1
MTGGRWVREVRGSTRQRQECQSGEGGVHKLRRCVGRDWSADVVGSCDGGGGQCRASGGSCNSEDGAELMRLAVTCEGAVGTETLTAGAGD